PRYGSAWASDATCSRAARRARRRRWPRRAQRTTGSRRCRRRSGCEPARCGRAPGGGSTSSTPGSARRLVGEAAPLIPAPGERGRAPVVRALAGDAEVDAFFALAAATFPGYQRVHCTPAPDGDVGAGWRRFVEGMPAFRLGHLRGAFVDDRL